MRVNRNLPFFGKRESRTRVIEMPVRQNDCRRLCARAVTVFDRIFDSRRRIRHSRINKDERTGRVLRRVHKIRIDENDFRVKNTVRHF